MSDIDAWLESAYDDRYHIEDSDDQWQTDDEDTEGPFDD